jgi:predicted metal-dependent hydrolase
VRNRPDKQAAADLLARVNAKLARIVEYVNENNDSEDARRLVSNYNPDVISESLSDSSHTSYSVNKGEKVVFCIRSKDAAEALVDENTMTFVAIHELAHLMTKSIGHGEDFWDNMRYLLKVGIQEGLYTKQDFRANPVTYCGTRITDTPLNTETKSEE